MSKILAGRLYPCVVPAQKHLPYHPAHELYFKQAYCLQLKIMRRFSTYKHRPAGKAGKCAHRLVASRQNPEPTFSK